MKPGARQRLSASGGRRFSGVSMCPPGLDPGPYFVLLDSSGCVVGCGGYALREETGIADLCWGMVVRELQGQGLGRELAGLRIEKIRKHHPVAVVALSTSQRTVSFYERLGFRTTSVEADGYGPGLDRCEMLMDLKT